MKLENIIRIIKINHKLNPRNIEAFLSLASQIECFEKKVGNKCFNLYLLLDIQVKMDNKIWLCDNVIMCDKHQIISIDEYNKIFNEHMMISYHAIAGQLEAARKIKQKIENIIDNKNET